MISCDDPGKSQAHTSWVEDHQIDLGLANIRVLALVFDDQISPIEPDGQDDAHHSRLPSGPPLSRPVSPSLAPSIPKGVDLARR